MGVLSDGNVKFFSVEFRHIGLMGRIYKDS